MKNVSNFVAFIRKGLLLHCGQLEKCVFSAISRRVLVNPFGFIIMLPPIQGDVDDYSFESSSNSGISSLTAFRLDLGATPVPAYFSIPKFVLPPLAPPTFFFGDLALFLYARPPFFSSFFVLSLPQVFLLVPKF